MGGGTVADGRPLLGSTRYLELAPLINRVLYDVRRNKSSKSKPPESITPDEEEDLKEVRDLLAPLERATKDVSTDKVTTLSKCIPIIKNLKRMTQKFQPTRGISFNLKEDLLKNIDARFSNIEDVKLFAAATLLDPRFKKVGFNTDERGPARLANAITFVSGLVKAKMRENYDAQAQAALEEAEGQPTGQETRSGDFWSDFDAEVEVHSARVAGQDIVQHGMPVQLSLYLNSPL